MPNKKIAELSLDEKRVEVEILQYMEGKGEVALTDIVHHLEAFPWSTVIMGLGALIREGLIGYKSKNNYILLDRRQERDDKKMQKV